MSHSNFDLDKVVYNFNQREPFTIRKACEGVQVFGGIGSGKSSASGAALAKSYLRAGFGGLVLCAKKDELQTWKRYAAETNRTQNLLVFDASGDWRFNFLNYEVNRTGEGAGYTENIVRLFMTVYELMDRRSGGESGDPFWKRAMQMLIRNAVDILLLGRGEVSIPLLHGLVSTAPFSESDLDSESWQEESLCWKLLMEADARRPKMDKWEQYDFDSSARYWSGEFPNLAPKTRSGIVAMFTSMADMFMRRPFRMLFSESLPDRKDAIPELTHRGLVIIMNLPVKEFGEAGRAAQVMYKYLWQQAAERRNIAENSRPVFLWADEAQNFVSDYDMQFQATARSSRACTVYLTQNLPNYYAEMGGMHSKARVDSLVGNLQTKIWHANSDPETNTHAADTIGRSWQQRFSQSVNSAVDNFSAGQSVQESFDYDVIPQHFATRLRTGSPSNDYKVDAIVFQNGKRWSDGKSHLEATFDQRFT